METILLCPCIHLLPNHCLRSVFQRKERTNAGQMIIYSAVQLLEKMINLFYRTHDVDEQEKNWFRKN